MCFLMTFFLLLRWRLCYGSCVTRIGCVLVQVEARKLRMRSVGSLRVQLFVSRARLPPCDTFQGPSLYTWDGAMLVDVVLHQLLRSTPQRSRVGLSGLGRRELWRR